MARIGRRLREVRESRGLTQERLAEQVRGMTRNDISAAENDRLSVGPERLARLAAALDVSVLELAPEQPADEKGLLLLDHQRALEDDMRELVEDVQRLARRVAALERRVPLAGQRAGGGQ